MKPNPMYKPELTRQLGRSPRGRYQGIRLGDNPHFGRCYLGRSPQRDAHSPIQRRRAGEEIASCVSVAGELGKATTHAVNAQLGL